MGNAYDQIKSGFRITSQWHLILHKFIGSANKIKLKSLVQINSETRESMLLKGK